MTHYVAIVNTPGYLPEGEPAAFGTAWEAWQYLAGERRYLEDEVWEEGDPEDYSETWARLRDLGDDKGSDEGYVLGDTPGYRGDHDLGKAYSVTPAPCQWRHYRSPFAGTPIRTCEACEARETYWEDEED